MKSLKDVKPGDKIFVLNSNRGYLKEPQIEILTVNKVGILYIYTDYDKYKKTNREAVRIIFRRQSFCNAGRSRNRAIYD